MASRGVSVGVEITGNAKSFKVAAEDAARASAAMQKKMNEHAKAIRQSSQELSNFTQQLKGIGAVMGVAFSVGAVVNLTKESMKLAAEAEGVKNAFMSIKNAQPILDDLKKATRGVIDESDLMQLAIKARNFNIPLRDLSTYLEFATNRAITTGKSVSELTDLIVTGLGRKSSRSFIQLGLSSRDVQEAFKKTHGIFNLVTDALEKMGPVADTAAVRFGRLAANTKNLKEAWGEFLNNSKIANDVLTKSALTFQKLADPKLNFWEKLMWSGKEYQKWKEKFDLEGEHTNTPGATVESFNFAMTHTKLTPSAHVETAKEIETIETLKLKLSTLSDELDNTDITDKKLTSSIRDQIKALREQISEVETGIHVMTNYEMALSKTNSFVLNKEFGNLKVPTFATKPEMPGLQKWDTTAELESIKNREAGIKQLEEMTKEMELQSEVAKGLNDVFSSMFSNIDKGFKGMTDAAIKSIERIAEELLAKAATIAIMNILFPGSWPALSGIGDLIRVPKFASGTNFAPGGLSMVGEQGPELINLPKGAKVTPNNQLGSQKIVVEVIGKTRGADIYWTSVRHAKMLNQNT